MYINYINLAYVIYEWPVRFMLSIITIKQYLSNGLDIHSSVYAFIRDFGSKHVSVSLKSFLHLSIAPNKSKQIKGLL